MNFATTPRLLTAPKSLKIIAESSGLVLLFVNQLGIDLYEVYDADGEFLHLSVAEQFDDNPRWRSRTETEQDAMITLALDEYYGTMTWDDDVAIPILPV
jgi:hypothetical protein